jgi:hypothetical protein
MNSGGECFGITPTRQTEEQSAMDECPRVATSASALPDMQFINKLPIVDVARELQLRFGSNGLIHCWHPDKHKHGDRTASVGVQKNLNRVKCFGCGSPPMGPLDLAADVLGLGLKGAAIWIAERFAVPYIAPRKHIKEPPRIIHTSGFETPMGLLIRSGLWVNLSPFTQRLVPVLLELAEFKTTAASEEKDKVKSICLSYRAMARYSASKAGSTSASAISRALAELEEIGWIKRESRPGNRPIRQVATYILTPFSETVYEYANATAAGFKAQIAAEKELRGQERRRRLNAIAIEASRRNPGLKEPGGIKDITEYNSLFHKSSDKQLDGSIGVA